MCADTGSCGDSDRTAWALRVETPLRQFLRTETGGAASCSRGDARRAHLGQRRRGVIRTRLGDEPVDPHRRRRSISQTSACG